MSNTYLVTVEVRDGENIYHEKELVSVSELAPRDKDFILELYGDVTYDEYYECWDISCGMGYPLVTITGYYLVKEDHIEILRSYGI
jgi:hypothetical protein